MIFVKLAFLFFLIQISNIRADEEIYPYQFHLDKEIKGHLVDEGHIFEEYSNTLLAIHNSNKDKAGISKAYFYDNKFNLVYTIELEDPYSDFLRQPLLFDFDQDGLSEIVFSIKKNDRIQIKYFDPTNTNKELITLLDIPITKKKIRQHTLLTPVQLDNDKYFELLVSLSPSTKGISPNGMWALDVKERKTLWSKPSAENTILSNPIWFLDKEKNPYIIYSTYAAGTNFFFSNQHYFTKKYDENFLRCYDQNFTETSHLSLDTSAQDYSCDSVSFLRRINSNGNMVWERRIAGKGISTEIKQINRNGITRIFLISKTSIYKMDFKNAIEIIDPISGKILNRLEYSSSIRYYIVQDNKIFISLRSGESFIYDYNFNLISSVESVKSYKPSSFLNFDNQDLLLSSEGTGEYQSILLLSKSIEVKAQLAIRGKLGFFKKSDVISSYRPVTEYSKIFSLRAVPWYKQITMRTLRNVVISFLSILLVIMLLWINTLRVSWKKIKVQKDELEATHQELQTTTAKLIQAEKLAVYGTIASGIAHEINSPLGAIINSAQRIKENKNLDIEKNINLIEKAGKRTKSIIEKLLLGTRSNKDVVKANLSDVIFEWKELSIKQFENLGIKLETEIKCDSILAISPTELNQILTNILFNARDSIMERSSKNKHVFVKSKRIENKCSIIIQDTGTGFSQSKLKNPFEAFKTTKEKGKGTGLGLWVVKSILDNIDGEVKIRNSSQGAEVEIIIPIFSETKNV